MAVAEVSKTTASAVKEKKRTGFGTLVEVPMKSLLKASAVARSALKEGTEDRDCCVEGFGIDSADLRNHQRDRDEYFDFVGDDADGEGEGGVGGSGRAVSEAELAEEALQKERDRSMNVLSSLLQQLAAKDSSTSASALKAKGEKKDEKQQQQQQHQQPSSSAVERCTDKQTKNNKEDNVAASSTSIAEKKKETERSKVGRDNGGDSSSNNRAEAEDDNFARLDALKSIFHKEVCRPSLHTFKKQLQVIVMLS
jgi:hypothetical protein